MSLVVLDTDVASTILRGRLHDRLQTRLTGKTLCITFVTLGELTKWTGCAVGVPVNSPTLLNGGQE